MRDPRRQPELTYLYCSIAGQRGADASVSLEIDQRHGEFHMQNVLVVGGLQCDELEDETQRQCAVNKEGGSPVNTTVGQGKSINVCLWVNHP